MWKIWITYYNSVGKAVGYGVHPNTYEHKSSAIRRARQLFDRIGGDVRVTWTVSQSNPWG